MGTGKMTLDSIGILEKVLDAKRYRVSVPKTKSSAYQKKRHQSGDYDPNRFFRIIKTTAADIVKAANFMNQRLRFYFVKFLLFVGKFRANRLNRLDLLYNCRLRD